MRLQPLEAPPRLRAVLGQTSVRGPGDVLGVREFNTPRLLFLPVRLEHQLVERAAGLACEG